MESVANPESRSWVDYHCTQILNLYQAQEYSRALSLTEDALRVWPDHPFLARIKGLTLIELGRMGEAIQALRFTKQTSLYDHRVTELLGNELMFQGYYHASLQEMSRFLYMTPINAGYAMLPICFCQAITGKTAPVLEYCDRIDRSFADNDDMQGLLATSAALRSLCYLTEGRAEEAWGLVTEVAEQFPTQRFVAYGAGAAAKATGDTVLAEQWLRKAIEVQPHDMQARWDLADLLLSAGRREEAESIKATITGVFGSPETDPDPAIRAEEYILSGKYTEALRYLTTLSPKPDEPGYCISLLKALFFTGDYTGVITTADAAPATYEYWMARYLKFAAWFADGNMHEAYSCLISLFMRDWGYTFHTLTKMLEEGYFPEKAGMNSEASILDVLIRDGGGSAIPLLETLIAGRTKTPEYTNLLIILKVFNEDHGEMVKYAEMPFNSDDPESNLPRVFALRNAGLLTEAGEVAREILQAQPDSLPAQYQYLRSLLELDDYRTVYMNIISSDAHTSDDPWIMELLIRCLIRGGDYHDAAQLAFRMLTLHQNRPINYALLGRAFLLDSDYQVAVYAFLEEFRLRGSSPETILTYIQALLQTGNATEASALLEDSRFQEPSSPMMRYLRSVASTLSGNEEQQASTPEFAGKVFQADQAELRFYIGDYLNAEEMFRDEIRDNPTDRDLRIAYASYLYELERTSESLHQVSLVQDMDGTLDEYGDALMKKILSQLKMHTNLKTLSLISGGERRGEASLIHKRAQRLFRFGITKMAISACHALIHIGSDDPQVNALQADGYHMLGDLEKNDERYKESCTIYDQLLTHNPKNAQWLAEKGMVLNNLSRFQEAKEVLDQALDLDSDNGLAYTALCWCLESLGDLDAALEMGNRAVLLLPDEWGTWNNRGRVRALLGNINGAVEDYKQAIRCCPGEFIPYVNLCAVLMANEDEDAYLTYGEYLIRFGNMAQEQDEEHTPDIWPQKDRNTHGTTGYLEGYW